MLSGPLTILFVSKSLTSEEIGFYYTFFSLITMQQLAELGLGQTLRLNISHAYKLNDNKWCNSSKIKIKEYIIFSIKWFIAVSLFTILIIGPAGMVYYHGYSGNVEWEFPWLILVITTSLTMLMIPVLVIVESLQQQVVVYKAQTYSSIVNSLSICILLFLGASLYTVAISLLVSNIFLLRCLYPYIKKFYNEMSYVKTTRTSREVFQELWPLFSRVATVSVCGFFFWNGFNLIGFKIFEPEFAGKVILSITLARAGYSFAESVLYAQMTSVSNKIANGYEIEAKELYYKNTTISLIVLCVGYFLFLMLYFVWPDFFLLKKTVDLYFIMSIFLFFIMLLILTSMNNFVRCYKVEPFVKVSIFHGICVPLSFYIFYACGFSFYLYPCTIVIVISIIISKSISKKYLQIRH